MKISLLIEHFKLKIKDTLHKLRFEMLQGKNIHILFLLSLTHVMNGRESIVLGSNFQNGDFVGFTCFEVPWI